MKISLVAGFGPITREPDAAQRFWRDGLGIGFEEAAPGYFTNDSLDGVRAFAMWPLAQAAESTFGSTEWPADLPAPQAWLEFDVESADAVAPAIDGLRAAGHRVLREAHEEPWGQTTGRVLSPEGLLVGITYTPWMHRDNRSMPPGVVIATLAYPDVGEATDWLCRAFGFTERLRIGDHRAQLVHEDAVGRGSVVVTASAPTAAPNGTASHGVMLRIADVDRHFERARQAGARITDPPMTHPYGERQYSAADPAGHVWTFSQSVADVGPETWGGQLVD